MHPLSAFVAGAFGAIIAFSSEAVLRKLGIDDVVSAFPVHGAAGIWGGLVYALFAPSSMFPGGDRLNQLLVQGIGAVAAALFSYAAVFCLLSVMKRFMRLRVRAAEERLGLNIVEHGATTEVIDLLGAMHEHRKSGDFQQRITADQHTEIGQIASEYNRVLTRVQDEMQQHETTNEWLKSEQLRLQSVLEHAGVGIYQLDNEGKITSANSTLLCTLGKPSLSDLLSVQTNSVLPWHHASPEIDHRVRDNLTRGTAIKELETEIFNCDGDSLWLLESLVPIRDEHGNLNCWLGTVHDVTERKQAMLAEVEIAEAKSEAKGAFLANMSHEIRTPLNGVIGMLDLLNNQEFPPTARHYVTVARSSADSLLALVNDILDFSKIEAGRLDLEAVDFDLRELIESTAEQFALRAHQKQLEMNCELAKDLPFKVNGDPERLRQVLINLMGNAVKFTDSGEINLRVARNGSQLRFAVQDTGIGMSAEVQSRLFQSFMQADVSTTRQYGGTGLGLAISSQLVQLMGGNISVTSQEGVGSEFAFELQLPVVEQKLANQDQTQRLLDRLPQTRVFIIDDNITNCEILSSQLCHWGMEVAICQEPQAAVERLLVSQRLGQPFDLVLLDFCMPLMDGEDVARAIRNQPSLNTTPILLLSSNCDLLTGEALQAAGIQMSITKPARQSRLLDSIMTLLHEKMSGAIQQPNIPTSQAQASVKTYDRIDSLEASHPVVEVNRPETLEQSEPDSFAARPTTTETQPLDPIAPENQPLHNTANGGDFVLVAEDNQVNQMVVQQMLSELGYRCKLVDDGQKACQHVQTGAYGLVLMDGHMPVMDGIAATMAIRKWEQENGAPATPIVALTANVVQGVKQQCLEAGMNGYVSKPITLEKLQQTVSQFLGPPKNQVRNTLPSETNANQPESERQQPPTTNSIASSVEPTSLADSTTPDSPAPNASSQSHEAMDTAVARVKTATQEEIQDIGLPDFSDVQELINQAALDEQFSGDPGFARQILGVMKDTLPDRLNDLTQAHRVNDLAQVRAISHQMKGAAGDCAMTAIYDVAAQVETEALSQDTNGLKESVSLLESRVEATLEALQRLLP